MLPAEDYLRRAVPSGRRARVLGVDLLPFTLGHAHVLARETDWQPCAPVVMTDEILAAGLWICSRPWRKASDGIHGRRAAVFAHILGYLSRRVGDKLRDHAGVFADYLDAGSIPPATKPPESRGKSELVPARSYGAPILARLQLFACDRLNLTPEQAMDSELVSILWLWITQLESEGNLRIPNADEISFDEFCREHDRKRKEARAKC